MEELLRIEDELMVVEEEVGGGVVELVVGVCVEVGEV